ncbi:hypothetical protein ABZ471_15430 [Streptomyces sp. NPDC005728]|uniref:hypothetical protein n=1 Tax=Streptomyces sp. NPDC005728 TaxID=3157054 RepID=UPI003405F8E6
MVGEYNVLPRDTTKTFYKAPPQIYLKEIPLILAPLYKPLVLGWCRSFTKAQVEKEYPLADAYTTLTKEAAGHWRGKGFDKDKVTVVHDDWNAWAADLNQTTIQSLKTLWGEHAQPAWFGNSWVLKSPGQPVFTGKLVGVAPRICHTIACQGPIKNEYTDSVRVTKVSSTSQGLEFGLTAEAGVNIKGPEVKRTASFKWSKVTTESTEVSKSHDKHTTLEIKEEGRWGRIDVRMCAGLYAGWIAYSHSADKFALYPMLAPVQVPGIADPVAEHTMLTPATGLSPEENAALTALADADARVNSGDGQLTPAEIEHLLAAQATAAPLFNEPALFNA